MVDKCVRLMSTRGPTSSYTASLSLIWIVQAKGYAKAQSRKMNRCLLIHTHQQKTSLNSWRIGSNDSSKRICCAHVLFHDDKLVFSWLGLRFCDFIFSAGIVSWLEGLVAWWRWNSITLHWKKFSIFRFWQNADSGHHVEQNAPAINALKL